MDEKPPKIIDNKTVFLADVLNNLAKKHDHLSIATGYWDIAGLDAVFDSIKDFKSIRLLIGTEPTSGRYKIKNLDDDFPEKDFSQDLVNAELNDNYPRLVGQINQLINQGRLEVKIYRKSFLHAKCYIFGNYDTSGPIGIVGSSNFTKAGLTSNTELNSLEDEPNIVAWPPDHAKRQGHLSWFDNTWSEAEPWSKDFQTILSNSPVGDLTYGPYAMYIKTLMEVYPNELNSREIEIAKEANFLYSFQKRNVRLLICLLNEHKKAMLADSVGLGKTITAGEVIRYYKSFKKKDGGEPRIYIIVPSRLKDQWRWDLADHNGIKEGFRIISLQDMSLLKEERRYDQYGGVDLFVIDEAHNLRNESGVRYQKFLEWFNSDHNTNAKILLLTATPVNNSLSDIGSQFILANKGSLESFKVPVKSRDGRIETINFNEAINRLSNEVKRAKGAPDYDRIGKTMRYGLGQFLVRNTRQGIEKENAIIKGDHQIKFPQSQPKSISYSFQTDDQGTISQLIEAKIDSLFEKCDPRLLNIDKLIDKTQQTAHPIDIVDKSDIDNQASSDVFESLFRLILMIGFSPHRFEIYHKNLYGRRINLLDLSGLDKRAKLTIRSQLAIHNFLRTSLLKRLESSPYALKKSLLNYQNKVKVFLNHLQEGRLMKFKDINYIEKQFSDDLERLDDEIEELQKQDLIEVVVADDQKYEIEALLKDSKRDLQITDLLINICEEVEKNDVKLKKLADLFRQILRDKPAGKKILVFSYFSDSIDYLSKKIANSLPEIDFSKQASFVSGKDSSQIGAIVRRFAPQSKGVVGEPQEPELDFLFATDVLSEGQNLQDCGVLINFDLHWNPVRVVQRNGRINRLGSPFEKVFIYNIYPDKKLEKYLKLVKRLEEKVEIIKQTIGTDQSVLGEDINPIDIIGDVEQKEAEGRLVDIYDNQKADQAYDLIERECDILDIGNHRLDLRNFLDKASPEDVEQVKSIALGKWGYLPKRTQSKLTAPTTIAFLSGQISMVDQPLFIQVDTSKKGYPMDILDRSEALEIIRTTESDNQRQKDSISCPKQIIKDQALDYAKLELESKKEPFKLTPTRRNVLERLNLIDIELTQKVDSFVKIVDNILQQRQLQQLFNEAHSNIQETGDISQPVVEKFKDLVKEHVVSEHQATVKNLRSILFYVK